MRRRRAGRYTFVAWLLAALGIALGVAGPAFADAAIEIPLVPARPGEEVAIWHIPHPDDETLGMAGAILAEAAAGRRNVVVIYTGGGASAVRHVVNGLIYCTLHQRYHKPEVEGYEPLSVADFTRARLVETLAALEVLGVAREDVWAVGMTDGALQVNAALTIMRALDRRFPDAVHRTTSLSDTHADHRRLARALYLSVEERKAAGKETDARFYGVYQYGLDPDRRGHGKLTVPVDDPDRKRAALAEFAVWRPEEGRFALGMHSVPRLLEEAASDPYEYVDLQPTVVTSRHLRTRDVALNLFPDGTTLAIALSPRTTIRVGASFRGEPLMPTLVYQAPVFSQSVMLYAGLGLSPEESLGLRMAVAGVEVLGRILLEYRPVKSLDPPGGHLRLGWRLDL